MFRVDVRLARLAGTLPEGTKYRIGELVAGVGISREWSGVRVSLGAGASGWMPDRIAPTIGLLLSGRLGIVTPFVSLSQAVDPHSPEQMKANYADWRPEEPFEPILDAYSTLPARGAKLQVSTIRAASGGLQFGWKLASVQAGVFAWQESNPAGWQVEGDTILIWSSLPHRKAVGSLLDGRFEDGPWRARLSTFTISRRLSPGDPAVAEPGVRIYWEIGRHMSYYDRKFETDFLLSGKYYSRFHSPAERPDERLGGALPIDARFTGRIGRFTFHYGLHNLGSVNYYLVPGYKMMHKEEYWGIEWLLLS